MTLARVTTILLLAVAVAVGQQQAEISNGARQRVKNFTRPGWFVVDGHFAQTQAEFAPRDLFTLTETQDHFAVVTKPSARAEPLVRNYRTGLIRLTGSDFAWKISCPGRTWDDTRAAGTQHLELIAVADTVIADDTMRLTKIEIQPPQQVVQAVIFERAAPVSVIVVFGRDFVEAAAGPFNAPPATLVRSTSLRQLMADRPVEVRQYVVPLLRLLAGGENPLAAKAGDVYRAFPNLPTDPAKEKAVAALLPDLVAAEPAARQRASDALRGLGRRGVQAAMRVDPSRLPPEAAERLASLVGEASRDARPADALRRDPNFLLDCLTDTDPNVRVAAGALVGK